MARKMDQSLLPPAIPLRCSASSDLVTADRSPPLTSKSPQYSIPRARPGQKCRLFEMMGTHIREDDLEEEGGASPLPLPWLLLGGRLEAEPEAEDEVAAENGRTMTTQSK